MSDRRPMIPEPDPQVDPMPETGDQPAVPEGAAGEAGPETELPYADGAEALEADGNDGQLADEFTPEQIDALVAERDEFLDAYRRTAADFDNFRKLSHKRLADEIARTQGSFVERLLPVLDAIDAARSHGSEDVEALATALFGFLEKEGLERVHPFGVPFDPNVAEAVVHEPGDDDQDEPIVTEVLRTGYQWHGRVIRPAMVKVAG
jgi:molecular chaperone GrpE